MACKDPREDYHPHLPWEVLLQADVALAEQLIRLQDFRKASALVLACFSCEGDAKAFAGLLSPPAVVRRCPC